MIKFLKSMRSSFSEIFFSLIGVNSAIKSDNCWILTLVEEISSTKMARSSTQTFCKAKMKSSAADCSSCN